MGNPTEIERQQAIAAAIAMRESGHDHVAKALLNLNYRMQKMERRMEATKRYLHAGQSATDHRTLLHTLSEAEGDAECGNGRQA